MIKVASVFARMNDTCKLSASLKNKLKKKSEPLKAYTQKMREYMCMLSVFEEKNQVQSCVIICAQVLARSLEIVTLDHCSFDEKLLYYHRKIFWYT